MNPSLRARRPGRPAARGFSLVELMVASGLGMLLALGITGAIVSAARNSSVISANASTQASAQIGLSLMDMAARAAGSGFYSNRQAICRTWNAWNGTVTVSNGQAMMPARIIAGAAATDSDRVVFTGGVGNRVLGAAPVMTDTLGADLKVSNSSGFVRGDIAVLGAPGSNRPCRLIQVSVDPNEVNACGGRADTCQHLVSNSGLGNPAPGTYATNPTYGFDNSGGADAAPAVVSRVGNSAEGFRQDAFAVQCNSLVRYNAFMGDLPGCEQSPLTFGAGVDAIASDVVLLQAQYGLSATAGSDVVTTWQEATGPTWSGIPAPANVALIKAIRVVVVARSRESDASVVTQECTNNAGVANVGPCSFQDAAAPRIDLSTVPVPANRTWRNYRYRLHMAILPLRTVIWSD